MWEIITWNIKLRNHIALTSVKLNHITISIVWNTYSYDGNNSLEYIYKLFISIPGCNLRDSLMVLR